MEGSAWPFIGSRVLFCVRFVFCLRTYLYFWLGEMIIPPMPFSRENRCVQRWRCDDVITLERLQAIGGSSVRKRMFE